MARQPDSPFATFDIDPETWSVQWFEEMEEKCRSFLGVEIHALPQVGDEVSVVAISTSVPPPGRGLCLIAESLTTSTASRLTDALAMLKNRQGLDAKQGLAFLVQLYLVHFDFLRATRGDSSLLLEAPWERIGAHTAPREQLPALKRRPLWQLGTLLDQYWSRPEQHATAFFQSRDGSPGQTLYMSIPPRWFPREEFEKIYGPGANQPDIPSFAESTWELQIARTVRAVLHEIGILPPSGVAKNVVEPNIENEGDFRHSSDLRSVSLRGKQFSLTSRQAQVVERLYEAYENGTPEVAQDTLIVGLELQSRRLHDVFKSRPEAWGELLIPGKSRGIYRLNR